MNDKQKYRQLCKVEESIPIFSKDWWMDAVCGDENWDVIIIEQNGEIISSMPYYILKQFGKKIICQPKLTQTNGIWLKNKENLKIRREEKIVDKVIDKLEKLNIDKYTQNFHYSFNNWLPFYWKGYKQTTNYTSVIKNIRNLEIVFKNFSSNIRNEIRKAEKLAILFYCEDINTFYKLNKKVFYRQGLEMPYKLDFLKKVDECCVKKKCRRIIGAKDKNGKIHAMVYIIWDKNSAYLLMTGSDPQYRKYNFQTLLIWEAIKYSSQYVNEFNFEGSMKKSIHNNYVKYRPIQERYFNIHKDFNSNSLYNFIENKARNSKMLKNIYYKFLKK